MIRAVASRMKLSTEKVVLYKKRRGLNMKYFEEIICDNEKRVYSLREIYAWNMINTNGTHVRDLAVDEFEAIFNQSSHTSFIVLTE